jgi:hypothetical protein
MPQLRLREEESAMMRTGKLTLLSALFRAWVTLSGGAAEDAAIVTEFGVRVTMRDGRKETLRPFRG